MNSTTITMKYYLRVYIYIASCVCTTLAWTQPEMENCVWTIYTFPEGNKASEGCLKNGQPEGEWKTYFENGQLKSVGFRTDFELSGTWIFFHSNGKKQRSVEYTSGVKNGLEREFNKEGVLLEEMSFLNGMEEGLHSFYTPDGIIEKKIPFTANEEHGIGREYAKDGRIISLLTYHRGHLQTIVQINRLNRNGEKTGTWVIWGSMERKKEEGPYLAGERHGVFKFYDAWGQLDFLEKYDHGELIKDSGDTTPVDLRKTYHPSGKTASTATYSDDLQVGVERVYNEEGELIAGAIFDMDVKIADGITDDKGRKTGSWIWYDDEGRVQSTGDYLLDLKEGEWQFFHPNGQTLQEGSFQEGKLNGSWVWYYPNGEIHRKEFYRRGKEDGLFQEWDASGKLISVGLYESGYKQEKWVVDVSDHKEEGYYLDNERQGTWMHSYPNGSIRFNGEFQSGLPEGKHTYRHPDGLLWKVERYSGGVKNGKWLIYGLNQTLEQTLEYRRDELIKVDGQKIKSRKKKK
jgi:uncharacterized protein